MDELSPVSALCFLRLYVVAVVLAFPSSSSLLPFYCKHEEERRKEKAKAPCREYVNKIGRAHV